MHLRRLSIVAVVASMGLVRAAAAQAPPHYGRPYDGIQAGLDAFRLAEERRQAHVTQQIAVNDQMRFWNGYPTSRGETIYYGYISPAAAVGFGFWPWPYLPGDIWGYGAYYPPALQPIGQHQVQTGPNRWESHPVYDPPLTMHRPLPPVASPWLDGTPYEAPNEVVIPSDVIPPPPPQPALKQPDSSPPGPMPPAPPARRGPREY